MSKRLKLLTIVGVAVFAAVIAWAVFSVPERPANLEEKQAEQKYMEYGPNTIKEERNGKIVWEVSSESSRTNMQTTETEMVQVTAKYYLADGNVITLTAPQGFYSDQTKDIKLQDQVKAVSTDGSTLTGKQLEWVAKDNRLIASGGARLVRPDSEITADRLEAWDDFAQFRAAGNAHIIRK